MIIFDTETTGLTRPEAQGLYKQPEIIEFAAVKLDDKTFKEKEVLAFFCKPHRPISSEITKITGITNEMVKEAKPFAAHYIQLVVFFLGEINLMAHNLKFDADLLRYELMRIDKLTKFPWPFKHLCTVELTQHLEGKRLTLSALHKKATGKELKEAHRAMNDVRGLVRCVKWMDEKELIPWTS